MNNIKDFSISKDNYFKILSDENNKIIKNKTFFTDTESKVKVSLTLITMTEGEELVDEYMTYNKNQENNIEDFAIIEYAPYSYDKLLIRIDYTNTKESDIYMFSTYDTNGFYFICDLFKGILKYYENNTDISNDFSNSKVFFDSFDSFPLDFALRVIGKKVKEKTYIDISFEEPCDSQEQYYKRFFLNENTIKKYIELAEEFFLEKEQRLKQTDFFKDLLNNRS